MTRSAAVGDPLREHYSDVRSLAQALTSGETGLTDVPFFLLRVLREAGWREFITPLNDHMQYQRFDDFVTTKPVRGLGATVPLLRNLCRDQPEVLRELDKVAGPLAESRRPTNAERANKVDNVNLKPQGGNSAEYLSRRLLRDAPETFAALERGEFPSVRAAAKAAGIVHEPTVLQQLHRLWAKATPEERLEFLRTVRTI